VTDESPSESAGEPFEIDTRAAHPERIYNYLLGGDDNFAADREAAHDVFSVVPGGLDAGRAMMRAIAKFVIRAFQFVGDAGVRQFLSVGTVLPMLDSLHDLARQAAPGAHVLYVVRDTTVLAQAHRLVQSSPDAVADFIHSDLRDPVALAQRAAGILDFERPVGVLVMGTLAYVRDESDAYRLVSALMDTVPSGSYLVLIHMASDLRAEEMAESTRRYRKRATKHLGFVPRSHDEVVRFFDGLDLVGPGVVEVNRWRRDEARPRRPESEITPVYGGVGRKP
jgi:hypothetical protein